MRETVRGAALASTLLLAACYPTLNWREVQPEGSGLRSLFPCKPTQQTRSVRLADTTVDLTLLACNAGDVTYAVGHAELSDRAHTAAALAELGNAAARNLSAPSAERVPWQVDGMTPIDGSWRLTLHGKMPDGAAVDEQLVLFAKGTRVFQATVLARRIDREAADTFFAALQLPS